MCRLGVHMDTRPPGCSESLSGKGLGWGQGQLSQHCRGLAQNSEESENSRFKPGLPGPYEGTFVELGGSQNEVA